jgi:hypothetical protein
MRPAKPDEVRRMLEEIRKWEREIENNPVGSLVPAMEHRIEWLKKKLEE